MGAGAGSVAGAGKCVVGVGAEAGGGERGAASTDTGIGTRTNIYIGGSVGDPIGVIHDTYGGCQVKSREYMTLPVSSSSNL